MLGSQNSKCQDLSKFQFSGEGGGGILGTRAEDVTCKQTFGTFSTWTFQKYGNSPMETFCDTETRFQLLKLNTHIPGTPLQKCDFGYGLFLQ